MNKEVLIDPRTGKAKKCWSLDVPGLLANGWERPGVKAEPEPDQKEALTTSFEPIQEKPKRTRRKKAE